MSGLAREKRVLGRGYRQRITVRSHRVIRQRRAFPRLHGRRAASGYSGNCDSAQKDDNDFAKSIHVHSWVFSLRIASMFLRNSLSDVLP